MGINIKDIPDSLLSLIKERFDNDARVQNLRIRQNLCLRNGKLQAAMQIAEEIESLYAEVVRIYLEEADKKQVSFDTDTMNLPQEDKERMLELLMVLFMCCDIIECSVVDVNDVLHRTKKDLKITTFDDINNSMKMAEEKLKYLSKNSEYMNDNAWSDHCNNMYKLMQNKAKSIIRKYKENNGTWGNNQKKYISSKLPICNNRPKRRNRSSTG